MPLSRKHGIAIGIGVVLAVAAIAGFGYLGYKLSKWFMSGSIIGKIIM